MASDRKKKKVDLSNDKAIKKAFGKVVSKGSELIQGMIDLKCITVSPKLDLALNGGIREASWNIISGDPKTGKSTTCLQICKNAQDDNQS